MAHSLDTFFNPTGILVVGASENQNKLGYGLARNIIECGYQGNINFVNPKGGNLFNKIIYKQISDVQEKSDLAVLLISSKFILNTMMECKLAGISSVIISSGGFKEIGGNGALLEEKIKEYAEQNQIRIMGPNCIGMLDSHLPLNTTFLQKPENIVGDISFVSHSGAICAAILNWANGKGFGFSKLISLGNQTDVNETDILNYLFEDEKTKVITMYMEGVSNGRSFVEIAENITKIKPIIALKVGRFESGQKAVASHTGALAGQETAFNAAFRRSGILRANTTEEMFDWAQTLSYCKNPKGKKVAILTNAGGPGVTAADSIENNNLCLSELNDETKKELLDILPASASIQNPVDMLASASSDEYKKCLEILIKDSEVDMVMVILPPPPMIPAIEIVQGIIPVILNNKQVPIVVVPMGDSLIKDAVKLLRDNNIPEFRFPENAASSLSALYKYSNISNQKISDKLAYKDFNKKIVESILNNVNTIENEFLGEVETEEIMKAYKIPVLSLNLAKSKEDIFSITKKIGFPVVLKIASSDIPHKSDIGGVMIDIKTYEYAIVGFEKLIKIANDQAPEAIIQGVYVQKMVDEGQEIILGAIQDPQFGPIVMFGSGGTEVEGLEDISFSLAPVTRNDIDYMFSETWAGKKLDGFRNINPADKNAVIDTIIRLGQLVNDFPQITEVEINPLKVLALDQGAVAVDVRLKVVQ